MFVPVDRLPPETHLTASKRRQDCALGGDPYSAPSEIWLLSNKRARPGQLDSIELTVALDSAHPPCGPCLLLNAMVAALGHHDI